MSKLDEIDKVCSDVLRATLSPGLKAQLWRLVYGGLSTWQVLRIIQRGGAERNGLTWLACSYELDAAEAAFKRGEPLPPMLAEDRPPTSADRGPRPA